jgi:hydrogenase maturation protease
MRTNLPLAPVRGTILVIGYGNTLRSDDGAGPRVALDLASRDCPGISAIAVHQLTPELADPLAAADLAIFVDARRADGKQTVELMLIEPAKGMRSAGHASDPQALIALARAVFGRAPECWLVTVPAAEFSLGEGLSAIAACGVAEAIERIIALAAQCRGQL